MTVRKIIPDSYTDYEDGHLGVVPASLANVEAKIGAADDGQPFKVFTLSGPDAKKQAKTLFQGGPLLKAIEEAFDAGSTRIHACRIGSAGRASFIVKSIIGADTLRLKGGYGTSGNNHWVNTTHVFQRIISGYTAVLAGTPNKAVFYDENMVVVREINLDSQIASVVGIEPDIFPESPTANPGFWVLGLTAMPLNQPTIWHYNGAGQLVAQDTINISALIPQGDTVTGLAGSIGMDTMIQVVTDKHLLFIDVVNGQPLLDRSWDFATFGILNPDISSAAEWIDMDLTMEGQDPPEWTFLLDRTAKRIYRIEEPHEAPPILRGYADIASLTGADVPEGIASDYETGDLFVALRSQGPNDRVLRLGIDWTVQPDPAVTLVETYSIGQSVYGLGYHFADAELTTVITIQDRNQSPVVSRRYEGMGLLRTATPAVAAVINQSGIYEAELLTDPAFWLMPTLEENNGPPDPTYFEPMTGGEDSGALTNADFLAGLEATVPKTDTAWIHAVGANTTALWTAVLLHCEQMFELHQAERFAILETPEFTSDYEEGSAGYLSDLQSYVDLIAAAMAQVGDKNAVVFAGGARYLDSDGNEYTHPVTSACGGVMAGLEVQKSLINKQVKNILKLVPEFSPGHIETLIQNRVNCVRFKPGRGFIIAHSLTAAAVGSDYSRANDLRAVYYGAKAAREAGQPYVGEENDAAGEGLRRLESAMARPLEQMRDGGQIDAFELSAVSTQQDRLLGDVYVSLGIQPRRAMEMIYTTVYLK